MVFVNDQKFACESCIKGHRSSSCKHANRPLFEIKKKGRPVSQCDRCRELRQSKRVHNKCLCNYADGLNIDSSATQSPSSRKKTGRFVPNTPALPNGISDAVLRNSSGSVSTRSKQRVDALLNPCTCKSVQKCQCWTQPEHSRFNTLPSVAANVTPQNGLATLANAAALYRGGQSSSTKLSPNVVIHKNSLTPGKTSRQNMKRQSSRPSTPPNLFQKRQRHTLANHPLEYSVPMLSLPPIHVSRPSASAPSHQVPDFPTIPPINVMKTLAGSGCTCGLYCACPGCVEHRGEEHVPKDGADCSNGCGTCVDWQGGIGLPATTQLTSGESKSIISQFYARAATLPLPPHTRTTRPINIDPMNVVVYPTDVFSNPNPTGTSSPTSNNDVRGFTLHGREAAFGLIKVPKLECCGGRCSCPEDGCGCSKSCDGRCGEHEHTSPSRRGSLGPNGQTAPSTISNSSSIVPVRSCCAKQLATSS